MLRCCKQTGHIFLTDLLYIVGHMVLQHPHVSEIGAYPCQQVRSQECVDASVRVRDGVGCRHVEKQRNLTVALHTQTHTIRWQWTIHACQGASRTDVGQSWFGWDLWLTLNNRRQSIRPKPDSRPRLGVRYQVPDKAAHAYSALPYTSVMHTLAHIINQTPSAMGLFIKGLSTWVQSRLDLCPKEQNRTEQFMQYLTGRQLADQQR